jgi:hypothetical protein
MRKKLASATIEEYFWWINERHRMYVKRFEENQEKPWTDDNVLQNYKFTNAFRQLDTGTIALNKMLGKWHLSKVPLNTIQMEDAIDILFNIVWYRLFNRAEHAEDIGWHKSKDHDAMRLKLIDKRERGEKIFTSAHMVCSPAIASTHGKLYAAMVGPLGIHEEFGAEIVSYIFFNQSMRKVTKKLCMVPMVGNFVAYEIACDLRFTPLLANATDVLTWANLGPGANRGLQRLGFEPCSDSMFELFELAMQSQLLEPHVRKHFCLNDSYPFDMCLPPFEIREIEHSLCEFDKYIRAREGEGRPRMRYNGT